MRLLSGARVRPGAGLRLAAAGARGAPGGVAAWITALDVYEWVELANTRMDALATTTAPIIAAWCGGAGDRVSNKYIQGLAGGHGDGSWNGVATLALNQAVPAWTLNFAGSTPAGGTLTHLGDGRPVSRHTYYTQQYIPERNRLFMFGCGALAGDGLTERKVDAFNFATNDFDAASTYADIPGTVPSSVSYSTARDPATGNVYLHWSYGGESRFARWNQSTATFTELEQPGYLIYGYDTPMDVDTTRNRVVSFESANWNIAAIFDIGSGAWLSDVSMSPSVPAQSAVVYVAALDKFISRRQPAGGALYEINPSTFAQTTITTTGGGSIPVCDGTSSNNQGPYSRFQYFPALGIALYQPSQAANCWAIKLHEV